MGAKSSWELSEGAEIAPGRSVLKAIGGGHRYEVYLVWDEKLFSIMVAKVLRPDLASDASAARGLQREAEALDRLAHPVLLRGFGADLEGPYPHVLVEHLEGPTLRRLIRRGGPPASGARSDSASCSWLPFTLRSRLIDHIRAVSAAATEGKHARIRLKLNHLVDPKIVEELYTASEQERVMSVIARSTCALRPGVEDLSENVHVRSIVGHFLEHSRVYSFEAGEQRRRRTSGARTSCSETSTTADWS